MDCREARLRIQDHLDDRLDADGRRAIEDHLAACADCAAEREALARTVALVRDLPRERAPEDLAPRVASRIRDAGAPRRHVLHLPRATLGIAAAAALLLVAVLVFHPGQQAPTGRETEIAEAPGSAPAPATGKEGATRESEEIPATAEDRVTPDEGAAIRDDEALATRARGAPDEPVWQDDRGATVVRAADPDAVVARARFLLAHAEELDALAERKDGEEMRRALGGGEADDAGEGGAGAGASAGRAGGSGRRRGGPPAPSAPSREPAVDPETRARLAKDGPPPDAPGKVAADRPADELDARGPAAKELTLTPEQATRLVALLSREPRGDRLEPAAEAEAAPLERAEGARARDAADLDEESIRQKAAAGFGAHRAELDAALLLALRRSLAQRKAGRYAEFQTLRLKFVQPPAAAARLAPARR